jgi:type II secretory pathway pseudopilin PulG
MKNNMLSAKHIQINKSYGSSKADECLAIGFEPGENVLSETGNLYIVFENNAANHKVKFDKLIEACGRSFYEEVTSDSFESRFKLVLKTLNAQLKHLEHPINAAIIATSNNKMLFSDIGANVLLLIRNNSSTDLSTHSRSKTFSEIGQGKLQSKDKVFIASEFVSKSIAKKQLSRMVTSGSLANFEVLLEDSIKQQDEPQSYCALLIELDDSDNSQEPKVNDNKANKITDKKFKLLMSDIQKSIKEAASKSRTKAKSLIKSNKKITSEISSKTKSGWTSFWSKYINPNPKQAIIVVILAIIIISILFLGISSITAKPKSLSQLENSQTLIDNAQSELQKNNKASAKENIDKAEQILNKISASERDKLNDLEKEGKIKSGFNSTQSLVIDLEDKLNLTSRISKANSFKIAQNNLKSLVWLNSSLYGLDSNEGSIIEINPLLGSPITRASSEDLKGAISMDSIADSGLLILGKAFILQFSSDKGIQKLNANSLPRSTDITTYLSNIYLLAPQENQVVRYLKTGLNLSSRASIIKNTSEKELSQAKSIAVNGNIFVSVKDQILLFEQGSERSYQLNGLPTSFGNIKDMYYNKDSGYFILLNEASDRLAMLTTESSSANFVRQYALESDQKISSFTIEPKNSQILINSGDKIYSYKIEK